MPQDADIYGYHEAFAPSLAFSVMLHAALVACVLFLPQFLETHGSDWGNNGSGGDGAMSATLVSGIPLPPNPHANKDSVLATDSKGLSQSLPAPVAKPDEKAIAIPDRDAKMKATKQSAKEKAEAAAREKDLQKLRAALAKNALAKNRPLPVDNSIPYGQGAPAAGPFTTFQTGNTTGGMSFGEGGGGSFGSRFGWYTDVVARKVHDAWQNEVNPGVSTARRVYILFDISRSGAPSHVKVEQSSGVPSLDQAAVRAIQRIDTFGPLPQGYNGNYVSVEFWFDYRR
jgi:protein TonB